MIKFGIVGTSFITDEFLKGANENKEFKLTAVYSRTEEKARKFSSLYNVEYIFTDLKEMAKSDLIDAVYIASPNSFHASQSILFLENKKHVFCEKPIASNLRELEDMISASKKNNKLLMEGVLSSFLPNFNVIRDNLYKIGKIRRYVGNFCKYSSRYNLYNEGKNPNTFNREFSNGSLVDIGIYAIYPLVHLFGGPNDLKANGVLLESGVDGEGSITLNYDGMEALISHSKITNSFYPSEIQGEKGTMLIDSIAIPKTIKIIYLDGKEEELSLEQDKANMYYELKHFIDLIKQGKNESDINSFERSKIVMNILDESRKQMGVIYPADR